MGKLSSIELGRSEVKKCICGMRIDSAKKNKCCHSKIDVVKLEDSHKSTPSILFQFDLMEAVVPQFYLSAVNYTSLYTTDNYLKKLPPNLHEQDTYKRICVFLIYDYTSLYLFSIYSWNILFTCFNSFIIP